MRWLGEKGAKQTTSFGATTTLAGDQLGNEAPPLLHFPLTYPRNALYEDVDRRTLEIPQSTRIFNHGLKIHNKGSQCTP